MIILHWLCYVVACACFVVAALPHKINIRFEWLAFAVLTFTRIA